MAGIIGIYGLVVSVLISDGLKQTDYALFTGFIQLGAGLAVGLAGMAAGFAIGIVGDAGVRGTAQQPRLFVGMILILIFAEVLGELFLATLQPPPSLRPPPRLRCKLTTTCRSLRLDRCPSHELQGRAERFLLSASLPTSIADTTRHGLAIKTPKGYLLKGSSKRHSGRIQSTGQLGITKCSTCS